MPEGLKDSNPRRRLAAAMALAEAGDFGGLGVIVECLGHDDDGVRVKAARCCERIGFAAAIEALAAMAAADPVSPNRNQAIYALAAIGRPAAAPPLVEALADPDPERRDDARTALYRVVGEIVAPLLSDEIDEDPQERSRVTEWWQGYAPRLDADRVYALGELASPGVFIDQLKASKGRHPSAWLDALANWTGQDFGEGPLSKVTAQWLKWWKANADRYEPGRRYFFGHRVP
jgi:hypothetical protein